jgi:hypothetical protein
VPIVVPVPESRYIQIWNKFIKNLFVIFF